MTTIITKNGSGAPTAGQLSQGELAVDLTNKELYTKDSGGNVIKVGAQGGSTGTFTDLTATSSFTSPGIDDNANATAITIDSNENVGIGESNPAGILHLKSDDSGVFFQSSSSANNRAQIFYQDSSGTQTAKIAVDPDGSSANTMAFTTGTSEAMRLDASGNVSIGTSSAQEKLHVYTTGPSRVEAESTTSIAGFKATNNQGSYAWYVDASADKFHLFDFTDSANRLTLDGSGNVGIGTDAPIAPLHVKATATGNLLVRDAALAKTGLTGTALTSVNDAVSATTPLTLEGSEFNFVQANTETMRITSSGNVGIGTAPSSVGSYKVLQIKGDTAANGGLIRLETSDGTSGVARFYAGSGSAVLESYTNIPLAFGTNGAEGMRLDASGNVLVGTTSASAKLTIVQPSGADREVILAGIAGVSNGFQVRYISGAMQYVLSDLGTGTVSSASGVLSASSDQNMKIADGCVDNALDTISALTPRYFYWKDEDGNSDIDKGRQLGFFAQEVNKVVPEAAPEPKDGQDGWGVLDRSIVATAVKAIQELSAQVDELKAEVAALKGA